MYTVKPLSHAYHRYPPHALPKHPHAKIARGCVGMYGDAWGWSQHKIWTSIPTEGSNHPHAIPTHSHASPRNPHLFSSIFIYLYLSLQSSPHKILPWYLSSWRIWKSVLVPTQKSETFCGSMRQGCTVRITEISCGRGWGVIATFQSQACRNFVKCSVTILGWIARLVSGNILFREMCPVCFLYSYKL